MTTATTKTNLKGIKITDIGDDKAMNRIAVATTKAVRYLKNDNKAEDTFNWKRYSDLERYFYLIETAFNTFALATDDDENAEYYEEKAMCIQDARINGLDIDDYESLNNFVADMLLNPMNNILATVGMPWM